MTHTTEQHIIYKTVTDNQEDQARPSWASKIIRKYKKIDKKIYSVCVFFTISK